MKRCAGVVVALALTQILDTVWHYCTFVPPPRVRVRATVKLSVTFFNDESSITIGGTKVQ